jgi:putative membrane protein
MWHWGDGAGWWLMGIGMVLWIILLALAIGLVVWLLNRPGREDPRRDRSRDRSWGSPSGPGAESAEEILRRRFAAGEIDADEYERRLSILRR